MNSKWFLAWLLLLWSGVAMSQDPDFLGRSEIVLGGGGLNYIGDLNNQRLLSKVHGGWNVGLRYRIDNRWALRGQLVKGRVSGGDPDYNTLRNLSFRSDVIEGSVLGEFSFWPYGMGATDHAWAFYIFAGLGFFYFNPMAAYEVGEGEVEWVALQPLRTEGQGSLEYPDRRPYGLMQFCVPFGVGMKWRINKTFTVAAEYGLRKTWTDYLDDVSTTYVGAEVLEQNSTNGGLAAQLADRSGEVEKGYVNAPGIKRGDSSLDDMYTYFGITVGVSLESMFGWMRSKRCK